MKHSFVILFLFIAACHQAPEVPTETLSQPAKKNYSKELIDNGFLNYAEKDKIHDLTLELEKSFTIYDPAFQKLVHIDAEELAELSFDFFVPDLTKILTKRNFSLIVQPQTVGQNFYGVTINGETIELYNQTDIDQDLFQEKASRVFFRKLNEKISGKTDEKFYLLYGSNDLHALLLTPKQFQIISEYYKNNPKEQPYEP